MTLHDAQVTGGVDTHRDVHVAAALDERGALLGTASFPTTTVGYRRLLALPRGHGQVVAVGVEGTGSYGTALTRYLLEHSVEVVEVGRPNRQLRRRHGKTDVIDAIAAARAVQSGEATATPKTHDGPVEALRVLKTVQRSAAKRGAAVVLRRRAARPVLHDRASCMSAVLSEDVAHGMGGTGAVG